ncbi:MAG: type II toxin-antitoxin system PemK/MazF family toxin [Bacteroidetes bacterium]|nr:type II toxin-antitoxin system PemK/MazF family toxin [Bacteroidota bacterium]MCH8523908.1 type II toxin-antitoxin system PemK/MazF family toxin [Balneolales bacterium]
MQQFDIWMADLSPRFGTEPGKMRPVVIVQTDLLNETGHPSTLICPITSRLMGASLLRYSVGTACGLDKPSEILFDQIRAIDNRRLVSKIGSLSDADADVVRQRLRIMMDL